MRQYPKPIETLIGLFTYLPGVGPKTAVRFVFYLLRQPKHTLERFAQALQTLHDTVVTCTVCHTYSTEPVCETCADARRDRTLLCVVAHPRDVGTIDAAGFRGRYHVLGGALSPLEGITPDQLECASLIARVDTEPVREVILAFNPDIEGESTIMYLSRLLKEHPVRVSRLARGLPAGSDLEFADEVTLSDALTRRWELT